jgi:hypothetical protein
MKKSDPASNNSSALTAGSIQQSPHAGDGETLLNNSTHNAYPYPYQTLISVKTKAVPNSGNGLQVSHETNQARTTGKAFSPRHLLYITYRRDIIDHEITLTRFPAISCHCFKGAVLGMTLSAFDTIVAGKIMSRCRNVIYSHWRVTLP